MGGPTQNFTPGKVSSTASAIKCADECQKVDLAFSSSQVRNLTVESFFIGLERSQTSPLISAARIFLAKPSLIFFAMSKAVYPCSYCFTAPSRKVIFITRTTLIKVPLIFLRMQI